MKKVKYIPNNPFSLSYGGFEIQTQSTLKAVQSVGVNASFIDFYSLDNDYEIIHIWGASPNAAKLAGLARKAGKKVVITALLSSFENPNEKIKYFISNLVNKFEYLKSFNKTADAFVVMNEGQKDIAVNYWKISPERVEIIPNVVENAFFEVSDQQMGDYLLCSGNICKRKNQLNLAKACIKVDVPLILLGHVLDGEKSYASEIESLINNHKQIKWIGGLDHASNEMLEIYKRARLMALPSHNEQQPISLLEAAAMQIPILTSSKVFGKQIFYKNAKLVDPDSIQSIAEGIISVLKSPGQYKVPLEIINKCKSDNVGSAYKSLYSRI